MNSSNFILLINLPIWDSLDCLLLFIANEIFSIIVVGRGFVGNRVRMLWTLFYIPFIYLFIFYLSLPKIDFEKIVRKSQTHGKRSVNF